MPASLARRDRTIRARCRPLFPTVARHRMPSHAVTRFGHGGATATDASPQAARLQKPIMTQQLLRTHKRPTRA